MDVVAHPFLGHDVALGHLPLLFGSLEDHYGMLVESARHQPHWFGWVPKDEQIDQHCGSKIISYW